MRWIDACHGLGGFRLGFEAAGAECVDAFDINSNLVEHYRSRGWKNRQADIFKIDHLEPADMLVCGAPCQPFSRANMRRERDARKKTASIPRRLFELAKDAAIPLVLLENVSGLLSSRKGIVFAEILAVISKCGFLSQWASVDCSRLGAPTKRTHLLLFAVAERSGPFRDVFQPKTLSSVFCSEEDMDRAYPYRLTNPWRSRLAWGTQLMADFDERGNVRFRCIGIKEFEAIQGFLEGWTDGLRPGAAYQALADSFPPAAAYTIAKALMEIL